MGGAGQHQALQRGRELQAALDDQVQPSLLNGEPGASSVAALAPAGVRGGDVTVGDVASSATCARGTSCAVGSTTDAAACASTTMASVDAAGANGRSGTSSA